MAYLARMAGKRPGAPLDAFCGHRAYNARNAIQEAARARAGGFDGHPGMYGHPARKTAQNASGRVMG